MSAGAAPRGSHGHIHSPKTLPPASARRNGRRHWMRSGAGWGSIGQSIGWCAARSRPIVTTYGCCSSCRHTMARYDAA